jgi:hypothetical protein
MSYYDTAYAHDPRQADRAAARNVVKASLWLALATSVVIPHSFQLVSALLIFGAMVLTLPAIERDEWLQRILLTYFLGVVLTSVFIWIGYTNGAPRNASTQTILIYILSPFAWIVLGTGLTQFFGIERLVQLLIRFTWWALISVALFFWAFLTIGRQAVTFMFADANVNVSGGFAGANILVYGSLIFLAGGAFAQPTLVKSKWGRVLLPAGLVLCAITSGRSAFALAVPIGFLTGLVLRGRVAQQGPRMSFGRAVVVPAVLLTGAAVAVTVAIGVLLHTIDLGVIFQSYVTKIASGGGDVRTEQAGALWDGIMETRGLGAGHGVGVSYIRNADYPWRYENVPLATMYRVGLLGTLIYCAPFFVYAFAFLGRASRRALSPEDVYMMGGFLSAAVAAWTNPYIESFIFQWMFFVPVMSFAVHKVSDKRFAAPIAAV